MVVAPFPGTGLRNLAPSRMLWGVLVTGRTFMTGHLGQAGWGLLQSPAGSVAPKLRSPGHVA